MNPRIPRTLPLKSKTLSYISAWFPRFLSPLHSRHRNLFSAASSGFSLDVPRVFPNATGGHATLLFSVYPLSFSSLQSLIFSSFPRHHGPASCSPFFWRPPPSRLGSRFELGRHRLRPCSRYCSSEGTEVSFELSSLIRLPGHPPSFGTGLRSHSGGLWGRFADGTTPLQGHCCGKGAAGSRSPLCSPGIPGKSMVTDVLLRSQAESPRCSRVPPASAGSRAGAAAVAGSSGCRSCCPRASARDGRRVLANRSLAPLIGSVESHRRLMLKRTGKYLSHNAPHRFTLLRPAPRYATVPGVHIESGSG